MPSEDIQSPETESSMSNRNKESYREENVQLRQRVRKLEKTLSFSRLETEARDLITTRAEEYFNIRIRKIWGQIATEQATDRSTYSIAVTPMCRYSGNMTSPSALRKTISRRTMPWRNGSTASLRQRASTVRDCSTTWTGSAASSADTSAFSTGIVRT